MEKKSAKSAGKGEVENPSIVWKFGFPQIYSEGTQAISHLKCDTTLSVTMECSYVNLIISFISNATYTVANDTVQDSLCKLKKNKTLTKTELLMILFRF